MEKKRTQRILGILVIIALVIILFPLLSEKNEHPTADTANLSAPQFPDQSPQSTVSEDAITITPTQQQSPQETASNTDKPQEQSNKTDSSNKNTSNKVSPAISMDMETRPTPISDINIKYPNLNIQKDRSSVTAKNTKDQNEDVAIVKEIPKTIAVTANKKPQHKTEKELAKLGSKAWAIQMGSFNNKSNALRLVDKLRVAGYKAFTREVTSSSGKVQTRVYIGPEFQQASALHLSSKVEQDMLMHGIVISYQPLAL